MTKVWLCLFICVVVVVSGLALGQPPVEIDEKAGYPNQGPPDPSLEEWSHVGEFAGCDFYIDVIGIWAISQGVWFTDEYCITILHIIPGWPPSHITVDFLVSTCFLTGERSVIEKWDDRFEVLEPYGKTWVTTRFENLTVPREVDSFLLQFNTWTIDAEDSVVTERVHRMTMIRDSLRFEPRPTN
jgi:hypothetical protein